MNNQKNKGKSHRIDLIKRPPLSIVEKYPKVLSQDKASTSNHPSKVENTNTFYEDCVDRAFRIPIFLSTTSTLNNLQEKFLNRLIFEIEEALLFPRTLPESEQYPETVLTNIRRLVKSSYGLLAMNFRRFFVQIEETNAGPPPTTTPFWQGSVFLQIEPSMAFQFGLPILLVREKGTDVSNGIWQGGITPLNIFVEWDSENQSIDDFFNSVQWREVFANWTAEVRGNYFIRTEPMF